MGNPIYGQQFSSGTNNAFLNKVRERESPCVVVKRTHTNPPLKRWFVCRRSLFWGGLGAGPLRRALSRVSYSRLGIGCRGVCVGGGGFAKGVRVGLAGGRFRAPDGGTRAGSLGGAGGLLGMARGVDEHTSEHTHTPERVRTHPANTLAPVHSSPTPSPFLTPLPPLSSTACTVPQ